MKKKYIVILSVLFLLLPAFVFAERQDITLKIDGEVIESDVPPYIKNGRTYVPVRFVGENFGMNIDYRYQNYTEDWDDIMITMNNYETGQKVVVEARGIYADGINFYTDILDDYPYEIINNRTFVPIRFIAEALHMDVGWDNDSKTVELLSNPTEEFYDLYLADEQAYIDFYNSDKNEELKMKKSNIYSIVYTGTRYELYPTGMTVEEFVDNIMELAMDEFGYKYIDNSEEFLYGNNCYNLYVNDGYATGTKCN